MKIKLLSLLFLTLVFFLASTKAQDSTIEFNAQQLNNGDVSWSIHSSDPRPLLYLVGVKEGPIGPNDCDDAKNLFAVRDVLTDETGIWNPAGTQRFSLIFCAFNIHGFLQTHKLVPFLN
jgi:hypothetical protein